MKRQRHTKKPGENVNCPVCYSKVEGFHFGVKVCRPCASYFRRTVTSKHNYVCSLNSNCEINHKNRTMCKGCRFKRCIAAGMNQKAVQYNRDPIGSKKPQSKTSITKIIDTMKLTDKSPTTYDIPSTSSTNSSSISEDSTSPLLNRMIQAFSTFCQSERSLYALLFPDKPVNCEQDYKLVKHTDFIKMERGALSFAYTLIKSWCPVICTFSSYNKMEVLRTFFSSFTPLLKCYRTSIVYPDVTDKRMVMSYGQYLDEAGMEYHYQDDPDPKQSARACWNLYDMSRKVGTKYANLKVRELEFIALSGIIFCNEFTMLYPNQDVVNMQEQIIRELHENIVQNYGLNVAGKRMGSLILLLSDNDLLRRQIGEAVMICKLFGPHLVELWEDH